MQFAGYQVPATGAAWTSTSISYTFIYTPVTVSGVATSSFVTEIDTTSIGLYAAFSPYFYAESFAFTATAPCCSSCTINGGNMQVFYWATDSALPSGVSTLVDQTGFTLCVYLDPFAHPS